ncbi:hypothetical protein [Bacteroides ndongoniae]|uniref:hypothetical protein n=1 Tax=Bacteroides ndongoniae TaxID=1903262 RepID=UPI0008D9CF7D|nr:hypothetical protein [Bacteroides ndongoniae]
MKYYIIKESINENIVGKDFPQVHKFIKGYNPDAPKALFSLYKYVESFPDYMPELDGMMLAGYAKLTDFVSSSFSSQLFIISENGRKTLDQYNLCPHRFYPLGLYKRKVKHDYFLLKTILADYIDYVDFEKSSFIEYNIASKEKFGEVSVNSKEELFRKRDEVEKQGGVCQTIWGNRIVMNSLFDKELDFFSISWIDSNDYVSERLKNAIEDNGLTGWEFTPATNLIVE